MRNTAPIQFNSRVSENDKRRISEFEQELKGNDLQAPPTYFTDEEKALYLHFIDMINTVGLPIGELDAPHLEQLVINIVALEQIRKDLHTEGYVIEVINNKGIKNVVKNPKHQVMLDLNSEIRKLYGILGLDAATRNKIAKGMNNGDFNDDSLGLFDD